ncbi:hypothetical protein D3C80_1636570 [compost metagenome]
MVAVFGQIRQMAKIGERADHAHGLVGAQALEQLLELLVGIVVGIAPKRHRQLAHLLHQLIGGNTILLTNHIAQDTAQQANVLNQRPVLVGLAADLGG